MTHLFEGQPDARQSTEITPPVSRFRPKYRALTDAEKAIHDQIKAKAQELEKLFFAAIPPSGRRGDAGRYHFLVITSLETSIMWAIKALTS